MQAGRGGGMSMGGNIVIKEPSMEDFNKRRKCGEGDNPHEKNKSILQETVEERKQQEQPFALQVVFLSAKTINGFFPMHAKKCYIVAWVERDHGFKSDPSVVPFSKKAVYRTIVEPGMKYLYLELVYDNAAEHDPEGSQRRTLVGAARMQLQNYRNQLVGRRCEWVPERLVHVSAGEKGEFRFEERWEVLMEISTWEASIWPNLNP